MVTRSLARRAGLSVAADLELPADLPTRRVSIVGMSGSGKSNALRTIVERVSAANAPFTLIDPLGASWGLRSSKDGTGPGLPVAIFGGYHADVEIQAQHGAALARELFGSGASAIIDLSAFDDEERSRFYTDHLKEMLRMHLRQKRVRTIITDEAQMLAPEQTTSKADFASRSALHHLHTGGRGSGLGCITATQSAAELSKKAMKQAELFIALRTFAPLDQRPVVDYLRTTVEKTRAAEVQRTLSTLADGEAWFISPQWMGLVERHRFYLSETFDSSRTPEIGETIEEPKVFASVDLARLRAAFSRADDESAVEGDTAAGATPSAKNAELREAQARVRDLEEVKAILAQQCASAKAELAAARQVIATIAAAASGFQAIARDHSSVTPPTERAAPARAQASRTTAPRPSAQKQTETPTTGLIAGQRRILEVLARCGGTLTKRQLSTLAGVNLRNGTLAVYLRGLGSEGYASHTASDVTVTEAGAFAIGATIRRDEPKTSEIVAMYGPKLKAGARRVLDLLVSTYPERVAKRELAEQANVNLRNGTFAIYLRSLVNNGLATADGNAVSASTTLFLQKARKHK